jgi:hypothetical protein
MKGNNCNLLIYQPTTTILESWRKEVWRRGSESNR